MKLFIFLAFIVATMAKHHQSEMLLDQVIDQLELELAAKKEDGIYFQNDLDEVLFVNWSCDRMSLMSTESTWSAGLDVALEKVEVGGTLSNTEKKEWTYQYMDRNLAFVKIQPGSFLEESTGLNCENVFVDLWTVKSNGGVNKFMSRSGVDKGEMVRVYGTADKPLFTKTFEVCGGEKCGCKQNKCWKTCLTWSTCDTRIEEGSDQEHIYFTRNSPEYKTWDDTKTAEPRRQRNTWGSLFERTHKTWRVRRDRAYSQARSQLIRSDGKVKCTQDKDCLPSFPCKGACTLWR